MKITELHKKKNDDAHLPNHTSNGCNLEILYDDRIEMKQKCGLHTRNELEEWK